MTTSRVGLNQFDFFAVNHDTSKHILSFCDIKSQEMFRRTSQSIKRMFDGDILTTYFELHGDRLKLAQDRLLPIQRLLVLQNHLWENTLPGFRLHESQYYRSTIQRQIELGQANGQTLDDDYWNRLLPSRLYIDNEYKPVVEDMWKMQNYRLAAFLEIPCQRMLKITSTRDCCLRLPCHGLDNLAPTTFKMEQLSGIARDRCPIQFNVKGFGSFDSNQVDRYKAMVINMLRPFKWKAFDPTNLEIRYIVSRFFTDFTEMFSAEMDTNNIPSLTSIKRVQLSKSWPYEQYMQRILRQRSEYLCFNISYKGGSDSQTRQIKLFYQIGQTDDPFRVFKHLEQCSDGSYVCFEYLYKNINGKKQIQQLIMGTSDDKTNFIGNQYITQQSYYGDTTATTSYFLKYENQQLTQRNGYQFHGTATGDLPYPRLFLDEDLTSRWEDKYLPLTSSENPTEDLQPSSSLAFYYYPNYGRSRWLSVCRYFGDRSSENILDAMVQYTYYNPNGHVKQRFFSKNDFDDFFGTPYKHTGLLILYQANGSGAVVLSNGYEIPEHPDEDNDTLLFLKTDHVYTDAPFEVDLENRDYAMNRIIFFDNSGNITEEHYGISNERIFSAITVQDDEHNMYVCCNELKPNDLDTLVEGYKISFRQDTSQWVVSTTGDTGLTVYNSIEGARADSRIVELMTTNTHLQMPEKIRMLDDQCDIEEGQERQLKTLEINLNTNRKRQRQS